MSASLHLALALLGSITGCAHYATFAFRRPAELTLRSIDTRVALIVHGNSDALLQIQSDLANGISDRLEGAVSLDPAGRALVDVAVIHDRDRPNPDFARRDAHGPLIAYFNAFGFSPWPWWAAGMAAGAAAQRAAHARRTEVEMTLTVTDLGLGVVPYERTFEIEESHPDDGSGPQRQDQLRLRIVDEMLQALAPRLATAHEQLAGCGNGRACRAGVADLERDAYPEAMRAFDAAIAAAPANRQTAPAYYNRALVEAYGEHFGDARRDLATALALEPRRPRWRDFAPTIDALERDSRDVHAQIGR